MPTCRVWYVLILMVMVLSAAPRSVHADSAAEVRKSIQALYDRETAAFAKRDSASMFASYSANFVAIDIKGNKHTLANLKQGAYVWFSQARLTSGSTKIQSISVTGNIAQLRVAEHSKIIGTDPETRTDSVIVIDTTSDDRWEMDKGHWFETKSKAFKSTATRNGVPFE